MLHHILAWKPWMGGGEGSVYARFMRRLLSGDGLAIEVPEAWLPRTLRRGKLAAVDRRLQTIRDEAHWRAGTLRARLRGRPGQWQ